jgi:hypothetical protein
MESQKSVPQPPQEPVKPTSVNWLKVLGIVVIASLISTLVAVLLVKTYLFPNEFRPVTLSSSEEQTLAAKLDRLDPLRRTRALHKERAPKVQNGRLQPERYSEEGASREIVLTERELNALLANNTDLATHLAIDLSEDLASARLLIPLDEELPIFGGKTLKVTAGLELAYADSRPIVALRGISVWGVPLPNAWLGNIKNVDLVQEFGGERGFWQAFADGVDEIKVSEERLNIRLKE